MAIKIYIKDSEKKEERVFQATVNLQARKTLDGNLMILDHADMDIVMVPGQAKVVTFAKNSFMDLAYNAQDRLFKFLERKGVIIPESIRGGNVYGSIEAKYPESSKYADSFQSTLFMISKFIDEERPYMEAIEAYDDMGDERLLEPGEDESTELGDVPHEETKGTISSTYPGYHYGLGGTYRY